MMLLVVQAGDHLYIRLRDSLKKILILIALCIPLTAAISPSPDPGHEIVLSKITTKRITHTQVVQAIIHIESAGNDNAYRACEDAAGPMQIRRTMVRDVNRILKSRGDATRYRYKDRWCRQSSIHMFNIYCSHYKLETPEEKARCWNGGPRGIRKRSTIKYWNKVKNELARN